MKVTLRGKLLLGFAAVIAATASAQAVVIQGNTAASTDGTGSNFSGAILYAANAAGTRARIRASRPIEP